ncbi:MAG TPA: ATP-binding cassette domain-containing protein [Acidimicrobiales bacterium]|nr:ATP-binding cassette domain-containing protein [Acidimicrobiales bacterium]
MSDAVERDLELAKVLDEIEVPPPSADYFTSLRRRLETTLNQARLEQGLDNHPSVTNKIPSSSHEQLPNPSSGSGDDVHVPDLAIDDQNRTPLLEARGLIKRFGHVEALRGANFTVYPGEVVALIGDNGAGKSVLVKCLSGAYQPDVGEILVRGQPVPLTSPLKAMQLGIETVYQDLALADDLEASANLFLGRESLRPGLFQRLGILDRKKMRRDATTAFNDLGIALQDVRAPIASLSGGQRQAVAVARSVVWASSVVLLDEPTAALGVLQRRHVQDLIRRVADKGISVVYVSHNIPEVLEVADRIEVLRLGLRVASFHAPEATLEELVRAMTSALTQEDVA